MAVVSSTGSHSPMSSIEHPSAPRTPPPPAEASEVHDDNRGQPSADESSRTFHNFTSSPLKHSIAKPTNRKGIETHDVVRDTDVCADFLTEHLRAPPSPLELTAAMNNCIAKIQSAGTYELKMYAPAASLLTAISKVLYGMLLMFMDAAEPLHSWTFDRASSRGSAASTS